MHLVTPRHHRLATVVAAGVWSGELLSAATGDSRYRRMLKPRKGHLLELERPEGMQPLQASGLAVVIMVSFILRVRVEVRVG